MPRIVVEGNGERVVAVVPSVYTAAMHDAPSPEALAPLSGVDDLAAVCLGEAGWWASRAGQVPALWRLAVGVGVSEPDTADAILRRRIARHPGVTSFDRDVAKVAAKRVVGVSPGDGAGIRWADVGPAADAVLAQVAPVGGLPGFVDGPADAVALADRLAADAVREGPLWARDRAVGAVVVGPDGRVLDAARNHAHLHRALHAEAVLAWRGAVSGGWPAGSWVAVSWTPCRMCQAWLDHVGGRELVAVYGREDPGRAARVGVLREGGRLRAVG